MTYRRLTAALLFVAIALPEAQARAGNTDGILLGDDASMMGGAVTAIVNDGSALWYNPAGLMHVDHNTVDLSLSAYTLRLYRIPNAIAGGGDVANADVNEVVIIPSAVSYVRTTKRGLRVGFGVFTTALQDYSQNSELLFTDPTTGFDWEWLIALENRISVYHGIVGVAWSANRKLHFGATADISYIGARQSSQVGGGLVTNQVTGESVLAAAEAIRTSLTGIGARVGVGLMWEPISALSLGIAFQTASFVIFQSLSQQATTSAGAVAEDGSAGAIVLETLNLDESALGFDQFEPYRLRAGLAYNFKKGTLSLDGDVQLDQRVSDAKWDATVNGRVGLLLHVSDDVNWGFGAFTDRATLREAPIEFGDSMVDFYGFTTGVSLHKTRRLADGEDSRSITFETAIAFRYAFGTGDFSGFDVLDDITLLDIDNPMLLFQRPSRIKIHEISVYLGGGVRF